MKILQGTYNRLNYQYDVLRFTSELLLYTPLKTGRRWLNTRLTDDFRAEGGTSCGFSNDRIMNISSKTRENVLDDICAHVRPSIFRKTEVTTYVEGT